MMRLMRCLSKQDQIWLGSTEPTMQADDDRVESPATNYTSAHRGSSIRLQAWITALSSGKLDELQQRGVPQIALKQVRRLVGAGIQGHSCLTPPLRAQMRCGWRGSASSSLCPRQATCVEEHSATNIRLTLCQPAWPVNQVFLDPSVLNPLQFPCIAQSQHTILFHQHPR